MSGKNRHKLQNVSRRIFRSKRRILQSPTPNEHTGKIHHAKKMISMKKATIFWLPGSKS